MGGAGMAVGVGLLEQRADFLQQRAAVGVLFELLHALPGDVHGGVAGHHVAHIALALLPLGKELREVVGVAGQDEVGDDALGVHVADALVEGAEVGGVGAVGRGEGARGGVGVEHQAADVVELLAGAGIDEGAEDVLVEREEAVAGIAHPEVRLVVLRPGPVVDVAGMDEAGSLGGGGGEGAGFAVKAAEVAGDTVDPFAGLGGREAHDHAAAAVPEGGHEQGLEARRTELDVEAHGEVGVGVRGGVLVASGRR